MMLADGVSMCDSGLGVQPGASEVAPSDTSDGDGNDSTPYTSPFKPYALSEVEANSRANHAASSMMAMQAEVQQEMMTFKRRLQTQQLSLAEQKKCTRRLQTLGQMLQQLGPVSPVPRDAPDAAAMLMQMSAPVERERAVAHDRSSPNSPSRVLAAAAPVHHASAAASSTTPGTEAIGPESSVPPWGIDAFTALVGVDVEMDPPAAPSPPRGKKVGTPPLLDFSKLKSYESPHTTARYSAHGSMDQPPSPSTPTTLRYPEDAGGAAASGGGGVRKGSALRNAPVPVPSPRSVSQTPRSDGGIGRGRPVLPTTPRGNDTPHVPRSPRSGLLCCFS